MEMVSLAVRTANMSIYHVREEERATRKSEKGRVTRLDVVIGVAKGEEKKSQESA
jgi:hypothetical protein